MAVNTSSENQTIKQIEEGLRAFRGDKATNVVLSILCDHPGITPEQLEDLSNRLGRHAHMAMRN